MVYILEAVILLLLVGLWWYKNDQQKYSNRPPGPFRIPIFGNLFQVMGISEFAAISFRKLADIYGDVMFLKLGSQETVVFTSADAIREILSHESSNGRIQYAGLRDRNNKKNLGIIWSTGEVWQTLRRFTMRNLRDYGFGRTAEMDTVVNEELVRFTADIKSQSENAPGNILHVEDMFVSTLVNVVWKLVSGKSFEYNDERLLKLLKANDDFFRSFNVGLYYYYISQITRLVSELVRENFGKRLRQSSELFREHQLAKEKPESECFIDAFTAKVDESSEDPDSVFNEEQFVVSVIDLLIGGSETSSKTLSFGILYMLLNPEVQAKIQKELDRELPFGTQVTTSMKSKLPYTNAAVLEMFRMSTILPTPSSREATADFYFRDHLIKKGTSLITNVHAVHYSKKLWGDPENFRPERFLNEDGVTINKKAADTLQSFGAGRRVCPGQSLAETTTFIYLATMLKNFRFEQVPGTNPITRPVLGITMSPHPYDVKVVWRGNAGVRMPGSA